MVVYIAQKKTYSGTIQPSALNTETVVIEITGESDDYLVEGYIDLSELQEGDEVIIREYIAVDGQNYRLFDYFSFQGPVTRPVVRFHTKTLLSFMKYKVTIAQVSGTLRSFPYGFIEQILGTS